MYHEQMSGEITFYFEVSRFVHEITPYLNDPPTRADFHLSSGWNRVESSDIATREVVATYLPTIVLVHQNEIKYQMACAPQYDNKDAASAYANRLIKFAIPFLTLRFGITEVAEFGMENFN